MSAHIDFDNYTLKTLFILPETEVGKCEAYIRLIESVEGGHVLTISDVNDPLAYEAAIKMIQDQQMQFESYIYYDMDERGIALYHGLIKLVKRVKHIKEGIKLPVIFDAFLNEERAYEIPSYEQGVCGLAEIEGACFKGLKRMREEA